MIDDLSRLDHELFFFLNSLNTTFLNPVMVFFSSQLVWIPFIALILIFSYKQLEQKTFFLFVLFLLMAIVASDVTSSYVLKNIFQRLRPCRVAEIKAVMNNFGQKCGGRFGFVSSHAANSFCIIVFTSLVLKIKSLKLHLLWLLPIAVGFSRIYLGVHYPGDILGGMIVGVFWGSLLGVFFKNRALGSKAT